MQIEIEVSVLGDGIKQIRLIGRLDMKNVLLIDSSFSAAVSSGGGLIVLDIAGVDFMASIGIQLLLVGAKTVAGRGGRLVLCGAKPNVAKTLEVTGIDNIITMFDQTAEAIARLREP